MLLKNLKFIAFLISLNVQIFAFSFNQANKEVNNTINYRVDKTLILNKFKMRDTQWIMQFIRNSKKNLYETLQNKNTLLHLAIKYKIYAVVKFLISVNFDSSLQNDEGDTPLHLAIKNEDLEAIDLLMKTRNFSKSLYIKNSANLTPVDLANKSNNKIIKQIFIHRKEKSNFLKNNFIYKRKRSNTLGNSTIYLGR